MVVRAAASRRSSDPSALMGYARDDGVVVGFDLLLTHRDQWFAHRTGFGCHRRKGQRGGETIARIHHDHPVQLPEVERR